MSTRLKTGGRFTDGGAQLSFDFNGKKLKGVEGDTLASALLGGRLNTTVRVGLWPQVVKSRTRCSTWAARMISSQTNAQR
jgi:hypothetical protein